MKFTNLELASELVYERDDLMATKANMQHATKYSIGYSFTSTYVDDQGASESFEQERSTRSADMTPEIRNLLMADVDRKIHDIDKRLVALGVDMDDAPTVEAA